jgi:serine/threonine-protein kinase
LTFYLSLYLGFLIVASLVISLLVLKLRLPSPKIIISLMVIFILSPLMIGYLYVAYFNSLPETRVPDVTGLPLESARQKIEAAQLKAREAGSVYEMKYPEGQVVSQRPEAGRIVKAGRVINLILSSGRKRIAAPNLLGRPFSQADAVLAAAGLMVGEVRYEKNPGAEDGTILAQEPLPGEEVEVGGRVDFLVSTTLEVIVEEGSGEGND